MINNLIKASEEWIQIMTKIEENDGVLTPELEQRFDQAVVEMSTVSDQLANTIDYIDTAIEVVKKKKDRYQLKQKQLENFKSRMREVTKNAMLNGITFEGEDRKVILTNPKKKINVDDVLPKDVPQKYWKVSTSINKTLLKNDIENGLIDLPEGAKVQEERTLQVR